MAMQDDQDNARPSAPHTSIESDELEKPSAANEDEDKIDEDTMEAEPTAHDPSTQWNGKVVPSKRARDFGVTFFAKGPAKDYFKEGKEYTFILNVSHNTTPAMRALFAFQEICKKRPFLVWRGRLHKSHGQNEERAASDINASPNLAE